MNDANTNKAIHPIKIGNGNGASDAISVNLSETSSKANHRKGGNNWKQKVLNKKSRKIREKKYMKEPLAVYSEKRGPSNNNRNNITVNGESNSVSRINNNKPMSNIDDNNIESLPQLFS